MSTWIRRLGGLLALLAAISLLCAFGLAESTNCTIHLYSGTGDTVTVQAAVGSQYTIPVCPDTFQAPAYKHFGGWRDTMTGTTYYQPGDTVTLTGNLNLQARWYFDHEYDIQGTLDNGMTWRLQISVGDGSGGELPDDAGGLGENRRYIHSASLTVTGEGAMPNYTGQFTSPWDSVLHTLWNGGNGLVRRSITHSSNAGSWQEAVPIAITLDDRITAVGSYCFTGNTSFFYETIHLPSGLKRIEDHAFYENYWLFDVQLPNGLTYIGDYAFYDCKEIVATTDETFSWYYFRYDHPMPYDGVLTIPDSVTYIGSYAFAMAGMYRVLLPHGLTQIRAGTFYMARDLNFAFLPDTLVSIGDRAFQGCGNEYEWAGSNGYGQANICTGYQLTVLPYSEASNPRTMTGTQTIHFPASLRTLGKYAFYNCSDVRSLVIPEGVTEIPDYCFAFCRHLDQVTLPESLTTIGPYAFNKTYYVGASVYNIPDITIPRGVTGIEDYALGFRNTDQRLTMTVRGYRGTEAERYALWGRDLDMSAFSYSQGTWTFIPLDTEVLGLFGSINGADYACGTDAANMGSYLFEATDTENVYTLTATFPGDSYVGLKRDKDDKDGAGLLYYSAAGNPGSSSSAVLTDRGETTDTGHLLFVPGNRKVVFTLTRNTDGSFTLSYEQPTDYRVAGDFTDWDELPFTYNTATGKYEYAASLDPDDLYNGYADFYLVLNGDSYGVLGEDSRIFDAASDIPVYSMLDGDGNYDDTIFNLNLYPSEAADFTLIFDNAANTLTVTSNVTQYAAYLLFPENGGMTIRMTDPAQPSAGLPGEEGEWMNYGLPDECYAFGGETTLWACRVLYDGEDENPYAFQIASGGVYYGNDSVVFKETAGGANKTVKLIGSQWAQLQANQRTDVLVEEDRSGIYDFYYGMDTHRVMIMRRSTEYAIQYDLSMPYNGSRVSFYLETFTVPGIEDADVTWYQLVDGEKIEYEDGYWWYEYGEVLTYSHYYGPCEVGDYVLEIRDWYGGLLIRHFFSITESNIQCGNHTYELTCTLDKEYDGEPVDFDPFKDLEIDGGKTSWGMLQKNGEARYLWRVLTGKDVEDMQGVPTEPGEYQLVIQEYDETGGKKGEEEVEGKEADWTDAAVFPFEITGTAHPHVYGSPEWSWTGTSSASAAFTCSECGAVQNIDAGLTYRLENGCLICVATVEFEEQTYSDSAFVQGNILYLPAGLTVIGSEAFADTAAGAVVVPRIVTAIADDAFPAGTDVYGYADTEGAAYAGRNGQSFYEMTD